MSAAVKNRRHLTPPTGGPAIKGIHAMRRGGARREVTERVLLKGPNGTESEGWALNMSRGGVRVILEEKLELGKEYDVVVGDTDKGGMSHRGRVVWIQEEPDGIIAGVEFVSISGTHPSSGPGAPTRDTDKPTE
jgi:hypothetical protein